MWKTRFWRTLKESRRCSKLSASHAQYPSVVGVMICTGRAEKDDGQEPFFFFLFPFIRTAILVLVFLVYEQVIVLIV